MLGFSMFNKLNGQASIYNIIKKEKLDSIIDRTRKGGGEISKLLKI